MAEKPLTPDELRESLRARLSQLSLPTQQLARLAQTNMPTATLPVVFGDRHFNLLLDAIMGELADKGIIGPNGDIVYI